MNAVDRNVSGSSRNMFSPMMLSRWRTVMPSTLDSALNTVPSSDRDEHEHDRSERTAGVVRAGRPAEQHDDERLEGGADRLHDDVGVHDGASGSPA